MNKLTHTLATVLRIPEAQVTDSLSINNTDAWDSLKHMELVVAIEEAFATSLTMNEIVSMTSVKNIKHILKHKGIDI